MMPPGWACGSRTPARSDAGALALALALGAGLPACELSSRGISGGYAGSDPQGGASDTSAEPPVVCPEYSGICGGWEPYRFDVVWAPTSSGLVKIDAATRTEVGRYATSDQPAPAGAPSRVAVSLIGEVAVMNEHDRWISVFARSRSRCVDSDQDGVETAETPGAALPWGEDECRRWYRALPSTVADAPVVAWDGLRPTAEGCTSRTPNLWVAFRVGGATTETQVFRVLPDPERAGDELLAPEALGPGEVFVPLGTGYEGVPYDAATDSRNNLWMLGSKSSELVRVDAETLEVTTHGRPTEGLAAMYALTVGPGDRLWMTGENTLHSYETLKERWVSYDVGLDDSSYGDGVQVDLAGNVWIFAFSFLDGGVCRLQRWSALAELLTSRSLSGCVDAGPASAGSVSLDGLGGIWLLNGDGARYATPDGSAAESLELAVGASARNYDATGMGLRAAHPC